MKSFRHHVLEIVALRQNQRFIETWKKTGKQSGWSNQNGAVRLEYPEWISQAGVTRMEQSEWSNQNGGLGSHFVSVGSSDLMELMP